MSQDIVYKSKGALLNFVEKNVGSLEPAGPIFIKAPTPAVHLIDSNALTLTEVLAYTGYWNSSASAETITSTGGGPALTDGYRAGFVGYSSTATSALTMYNGIADSELAFYAGATKKLSISADGSTQPGFLASVPLAGQATVEAEWIRVSASSEVYDNGEDYNETSAEFSAPVDGKYLFTWNVRLTNVDDDSEQYVYSRIMVDDHTYYGSIVSRPSYGSHTSRRYASSVGSAMVSMVAGDKAELQVYVRYDEVLIYNGDPSTGTRTFWGGWLIG